MIDGHMMYRPVHSAAERRRHGDCFPLPSEVICDKARVEGIKDPQRAGWLADALNKLALHDSFCNSKVDRVLPSKPSLTKTQNAVCDRVLESLQLYGSDESDSTGRDALRSLCGGKPAYDGIPNNLASYSEERLKILKSTMQPRHVRDFLPVEAQKLLDHADTMIVKQTAVDDEGFSPYWDPVLRHNRGERLRFILKLFNSGLLTLRAKPRSHVGIFFVKKKDPNFIRMVIDCRGTNRLHEPPPVTRLASARCYGDLQLGEETQEPYAWGMEADVNDCFYRFGIPELAHFFSINHPMTTAQWRRLGVDVGRIYDQERGGTFRPHDDQLLFPCFQAVPMGWAWALFFCNEAVLNIALKGTEWKDGVVRERKVMPQLHEYRTLLGVYVDNITILGSSREDVLRRSQLLDQAFEQAGIPITWTQTEPTCKLESVGCLFDFQKGILMNKPNRVWRFAKATSELLKRKKLSGHILQVWTGHFTSLCSLTPWGLACLQHVYRFIESCGDRRINVWPSVRSELKNAGSLVWMTWKQLNSPVMRVVEVGDSSGCGYAMMASYPDPSITREAIRVHEKWRFIPMPNELRQLADSEDHVGFQKLLGELLTPGQDHQSGTAQIDKPPDMFQAAGLSTQYAKKVVESLREGSLLKTSAIRSQIRARPQNRVDIEVPSLVEPVHDFFANDSHFRLLWAKRWKRIDEHITLKEMRVALSSLRRSSRVAELFGMRKLTLCDNLGVVCAFSKGRATTNAMNALCKQASAIQFATGILWSVRHLETGRNPADRPSRFYERRKRVETVKPREGVNLFGGGSSSGASCSSNPRREKNPNVDQSSYPRGRGRFFLELFSGKGRLTEAFKKIGAATVHGIDYVNGSDFDLRRRSTQQLILRWIEKGIFGFVHLGTPCTIWSIARKGVKESATSRAKEELGIEMALFSSEVIRACNKHRIPFALENPRTSKLFHFEPLLRALSTGHWEYVDLDMCRYGEDYRKSTRIVTSFHELQKLSRKCCHHSHETWLKGKVRIIDEAGKPVYVNRTALAGAYPHSLCSEYARIVTSKLDLTSQDVPEVQKHWRAEIGRVANWKPRKNRVAFKTNGVGKTDNAEEFVLLRRCGGVPNFLDFISLGRPKADAWKEWSKKNCSKTKR